MGLSDFPHPFVAVVLLADSQRGPRRHSGPNAGPPGCPSSLLVRDWTLGPDRPRAHAGERGQRAREGAEDELLGDQPNNASDQADSGCLSPLVSMVQSTDSRQCDDFRRRRRSVRDRSQARCVLVQPQVATVLMIVADVSSHEPDEMTCAENHDVLKELATAAARTTHRGTLQLRVVTRDRRLLRPDSARRARRSAYPLVALPPACLPSGVLLLGQFILQVVKSLASQPDHFKRNVARIT